MRPYVRSRIVGRTAPAEPESRLDVHGERTAPERLVGPVQSRSQHQTRAVGESVDTAVPRERLFDERRARPTGAEVVIRGFGRAAGAADLVNHRVGNRWIAAGAVTRHASVVNDHGRAVPSDHARVRRSQTPSGAGYEHDPAGEVDHRGPKLADSPAHTPKGARRPYTNASEGRRACLSRF